MKPYNNIVGIFILALLVSACATGPLKLPEKYSLDGQLEQVTEIYKYKLIDWDRVDQQSLLLRAGPGDYYLLVLKTPSTELMFTNSIRLSTTSSMVRAGMDDVILYGPGRIKYHYTIERIYKIKGRQQMLAIKKQLTEGAEEGHHKNQKDKNGISI